MAFEHASRAPFPRFVAEVVVPLLTVPDRDRWLRQIDDDDYQVVATRNHSLSRVMSAAHADWTGNLRWLARAMEEVEVRSVVLHGQVIAGAGGEADHAARRDGIQSGAGPDLRFIVSDIQYIDGIDLREVALENRLALLAQLLHERLPRIARHATA